MLDKKEQLFKKSAYVFFIYFFIIGCFSFSDYGLSVDEMNQHTIGAESYNLITTGGHADNLLASDEGKYHGASFEIFLYSVEKLLKLTHEREINLLRHGLSFFVFFVSTIFFYLLVFKIFKKYSVALLCSAMLVMSPRIFAESFYNSKDIPLLCFCIITSYTAFLFIERQTIGWALIHSICCGFAIDIRIMAILIPMATLYLYLMQKQRKIIPLLVYMLCTLFFIVVFWPVLWPDPIHNFIQAFKTMSHYSLFVDVLYQGNIVAGPNLPWHYLPVWIAITTPICYTILFLVGLFFAIKNIVVKFTDTLPIQFFLFMFITPILAVIILHSTVYDSWRHVYFVYPYFLLIAIYGFTELMKVVKRKLARNIISYSTILSILFVSVFMTINHPFENVYFNSLAGKNIRKNFDMDYWGLSFRQGIEYILKHDSSKKIFVTSDMGVCWLNFDILPAEQRNRIFFASDIKHADYFLTNYRLHPASYDYGPSIFQIKVGNDTIMEVLNVKYGKKW